MAWPIVTVASGGLPVTEATNGYGTPFEEAVNGFGTPVTFVASGGIPVVAGMAGPYPAPAGFRWDWVISNGNPVISNGNQVVALVRAV